MYRWVELVNNGWSEEPGSSPGRQSWSVRYDLKVQLVSR